MSKDVRGLLKRLGLALAGWLSAWDPYTVRLTEVDIMVTRTDSVGLNELPLGFSKFILSRTPKKERKYKEEGRMYRHICLSLTKQ